MRGLDLLGADDATAATAAMMQKAQQKRTPPTDGGGGGNTNWAMIGGVALTVVVLAVALPRILAD